MSTKHLLRSELQKITDYEGDWELKPEALPAFRELRNRALSLAVPNETVTRTEVTITSADGTEIQCLLYQPAGITGPLPAYLHIHGGGYITGSIVGSDPMNLMICSKLKAVVLAVGYRLAPEANARAALDDCYTGLAYLHANAEALGVDPNRIAVGGESAGGGLAAALTIEARDKGEFAICHQHLTYPMLDNRTGTTEQPGDPLTGEFIWTRERNQFGWACFLGDLEPSAPFVPAKLENFSGLPPAWLYTVTLDLFRDENIDYARQLMQAGIACELVVVPGACHGFQFIPGTKIGAEYVAAHLRALAAGLAAA